MTFCRADDNKYNICQMATILQIIYMVEISKEVHSSSFKASLADGNVCVIDVKNVDVIYNVICHVCAVGEETWFGCVWNGWLMVYGYVGLKCR